MSQIRTSLLKRLNLQLTNQNKMSRERTVQAFIIKKQDYGEADQIITLFSKEEGKLRAIVKAAKLPTSKLQPMLQPVFQTRVSLSGSSGAPGLGKVIGVQLISPYSGILDGEAKITAWYIASELVMRGLADSAPNELLFLELEKYANFLNTTKISDEEINSSIMQFQIKAIDALGLGIRVLPQTSEMKNSVYFSLDNGGFTTQNSTDAFPVNSSLLTTFHDLNNQTYETSKTLNSSDYKSISSLVNRFVSYQLEREIKSQRLLNNPSLA